MDRRHLDAFLGRQAPEAIRPPLRELLYAPPALDEQRPNCANCGHYMLNTQACELHGPGVLVSPSMICGMHLEGLPLAGARTQFRTDVRYLEPDQSWLRDAAGGACCSRCAHFEQMLLGSGECGAAVGEDGESAIVHALGRCVRWSPA